MYTALGYFIHYIGSVCYNIYLFGTSFNAFVALQCLLQISRLIGDFECVTFVLNSAEQAAGKVMKQLLQQDPSTSDKDSMEESELKDFQFVAARLGITSPTAILIEKRSIKKLLEKLKRNDQTKEIVLKNL